MDKEGQGCPKNECSQSLCYTPPGEGLTRLQVESVKDTIREQLLVIQSTRTYPDPQVLTDLRKRKLIAMSRVIHFAFSKGSNFSTTFQKEETDLTADMLTSGAWKDVKLKPYNFKAKGIEPDSGALHPLNKVRQEFRQIFFEMGFEEMPTNRYVESGFWNFDALFVPQQHPARDLQDTFYISDPAEADLPRADQDDDASSSSSSSSLSIAPLSSPPSSKTPNTNSPSSSGRPSPSSYLHAVHKVHESGAFSSLGYRYPFSLPTTRRLLLRTHTTSVSSSMLYRLASSPRPVRYFSIDRVFRNESVDATHLAEFHQVEGVIADYGLTLGGLIGFMEVFFAKMGIRNLRFKPAYNPYTEPSLEIFSYHPGLNKTVEIGNSGMFRPEMLKPMGLPKDMRVFGWGLSLERPTMIKYGVKNIRELLGHKVDLGFVRRNAAVRLDKD